jgi:cysteine desulfurase
VRLVPELAGGGQEGGRRPGTLNVAGIVGFGAAAEIARREGAAEARRVGALRDRFRRALGSRVRVNGSMECRLPGNLSVCIDGVDGRALVEELDARGVACSTGSACSNGKEPSHVLLAIGRTEEEARCAIRFGLGRWTTAEEVDRTARMILEAWA